MFATAYLPGSCDGSLSHQTSGAGFFTTVTILTALVVGLPDVARAQDSFLEITPAVANGFFPSRVLDITAADGTRLESRLEDALGGSLTIAFRPLSGLTLEVEGILIDNAQSSTGGVTMGEGFSAETPTAYGYYGGAIRYQLPTGESDVRPFVIVGVGEKEFDPSVLGTKNPFTVNFGGGVRLLIPGWPDIRTEVRDYVSQVDVPSQIGDIQVDSNVQHDLFWKIGAVLELF